MFEKVNPQHPDKVADRIAGAIVDIAYKKENSPNVAAEVMIGHGVCHTIVETSADIKEKEIDEAIKRIAGKEMESDIVIVKQDEHLAKNQEGRIRCGDNGIFKGVPITTEQIQLTEYSKMLYEQFPTDGKFILSDGHLTICQSHARTEEVKGLFPNATINPLGYWTGGPDVDTGATNRKLGSDMGDSVTGGGINGKDASKGDVSINIYAFLKAQRTGKPVEISCAIGDEVIDNLPYEKIVEIALNYINQCGGFEKFSEWGLIRP